MRVPLWSSQGLVGNEEMIATLGPDNKEEEGELPMDWNAIHVL